MHGPGRVQWFPPPRLHAATFDPRPPPPRHRTWDAFVRRSASTPSRTQLSSLPISIPGGGGWDGGGGPKEAPNMAPREAHGTKDESPRRPKCLIFWSFPFASCFVGACFEAQPQWIVWVKYFKSSLLSGLARPLEASSEGDAEKFVSTWSGWLAFQSTPAARPPPLPPSPFPLPLSPPPPTQKTQKTNKHHEVECQSGFLNVAYMPTTGRSTQGVICADATWFQLSQTKINEKPWSPQNGLSMLVSPLERIRSAQNGWFPVFVASNHKKRPVPTPEITE